jgi:hypothetical protein
MTFTVLVIICCVHCSRPYPARTGKTRLSSCECQIPCPSVQTVLSRSKGIWMVRSSTKLDAEFNCPHKKRLGDVWDRSHSELEVWPSIARRVPPVDPGLIRVDWVSTPHPRLALVQRRSQTPHTVIVVVKHRSVSSHLRWLVPRHNSSLLISVQVAQFTSHPVAPLLSAQLTRCCDLATPDSVALKSCSVTASVQGTHSKLSGFSLLIDD